MHILNGFPSVQLMACHQKVITGNLWIGIWVFESWLQGCVHWFTFETYIQSLNSGFPFADFVIFAFMAATSLLLALTSLILLLISWVDFGCFISFFIVTVFKTTCVLWRALVYLRSLSSSVLIFIVYKITSLRCKKSSLSLYVLRKYFIISRYKDILKL